MRYYIIILIAFVSFKLFSQETGDSLLYVPINDSLKNAVDSTRKSDIDAIIEYSASDSAIFDISGDKLMLYNDAQLKYKEFDLKAARIVLFRESSIMEANGIPDTALAGKFMGTPIFMEGAKRYDAVKLRYNFSTRQGVIDMGSTELEGGYYLGEKIKKVDENIFFIKNGRYTTCDRADPDYYFGSPKLKIIQGDRVIAEPVYLFIDDVPIFALPFGIFPNHSGRSSGIIPPAYGEDPTYGRYLSHLGYFWAINDYVDLALQGNYYTKGRIDLSSRFRYVMRYKLSGSVDIGGSRIRLGEENDNDKQFGDEWRIGVYHNQTIDPTTTLTANVNFLSSKNYYNTSTNNLDDLLRQNALSNVTLSKYWEGTPNSASINYSRDQNLTTGEILQTIPSVTFSRTQSFPFRGKNTSLLNLNWYEQLSYTYNSAFRYIDEKRLVNSAVLDGNFRRNTRGGIRQAVVLNAPLKISEFNLTPFFSYNEIWYDKSVEKTFNSADSTVITNDVKGFKAFRYFNTGITLSTRLIGLFNTKIFGVRGFRHTVTPSVTYGYTPDFSEPQWNAYKTYVNQYGQEVKYSIYEREVFGGAPMGEQQALNFSVGNVFEMKVKDTDSTDTKFQLLNLTAGLNYNFAADSLRFSEIGLSYRTQIGDFLNIGGGATFNLYKYVDGVGRINKFLWNEDKKIAQLTNFNISLSSTLAGGEIVTEEDSTLAEKELEQTSTYESEYVGVYADKPVDFSIPWSVTLSYNYSINRANPSVITKFSNVSGNLNFNLTRNWKFTFSAGYDIFLKQFSTPYITIYRDLHCWEMSFNWVPTGIYRGYKFELRIKAPQLQDVKVTKQTNYRGVF
ncbi:MAG: Organic solvent tolerance protein OstA [Chlorobi bacterium OLB5]|nr:MAG: Organic solvent tolerance protein OstA [Chlorobi bacterium OLB5]